MQNMEAAGGTNHDGAVWGQCDGCHSAPEIDGFERLRAPYSYCAVLSSRYNDCALWNFPGSERGDLICVAAGRLGLAAECFTVTSGKITRSLTSAPLNAKGV